MKPACSKLLMIFVLTFMNALMAPAQSPMPETGTVERIVIEELARQHARQLAEVNFDLMRATAEGVSKSTPAMQAMMKVQKALLAELGILRSKEKRHLEAMAESENHTQKITGQADTAILQAELQQARLELAHKESAIQHLKKHLTQASSHAEDPEVENAASMDPQDHGEENGPEESEVEEDAEEEEEDEESDGEPENELEIEADEVIFNQPFHGRDIHLNIKSLNLNIKGGVTVTGSGTALNESIRKSLMAAMKDRNPAGIEDTQSFSGFSPAMPPEVPLPGLLKHRPIRAGHDRGNMVDPLSGDAR